MISLPLAVPVACALDIILSAASPPPLRADTAIVLGAATSQDSPSPVLQARIDHTIDLYRQGHVRMLILTGGTDKPGQRSEGDISADYARGHGVPSHRLLIERRSQITEQNLANAHELMRRHGLESALIVSDPLHMHRATLIARDQGITAQSAPTPYTRIRSISNKGKFLARETLFYALYLATRQR